MPEILLMRYLRMRANMIIWNYVIRTIYVIRALGFDPCDVSRPAGSDGVLEIEFSHEVNDSINHAYVI